MAVQKPIRILYQSKNKTTGLTDVKAQCYFNGVAKATGSVGSPILLTEVDSTNSPGLYELVIPAATLTTWGALQGQYNCVEGYINSATQPASAPFREEVTVANNDDIDVKLGTPAGASVSADIAAVQTKLGTPAGASVSADIAAVKTDTTAIRADLETGSSSLATILSNIQSLQNASIGNGVGFVLPQMLIPVSGTNTYKVPITIVDNNGALIDPNTNTITVGCLNAAGTDRGSYLAGSSGTPATVVATRTSVGQYYVTVNIPTTAIEEELVFSFSYIIGSNSMIRYGLSQVLVDGGAAGYALQSTLLSVQTAVNTANSTLTNSTYGLSALDAILANGTYGLAALGAILGNGTYGLNALELILTNGTYGLSALQALLGNATYGLSALQVQGATTQGVGFTAGQDDLHSISTFVRANIYSGGRAI